MVRASVLGMANGDYQFLFVKTVIPSSEDKAMLGTNHVWYRGDGLDGHARKACESLLYVSLILVNLFSVVAFASRFLDNKSFIK